MVKKVSSHTLNFLKKTCHVEHFSGSENFLRGGNCVGKTLGLDSDIQVISSVESENSAMSTKEQSILAQEILCLSGKL